MSSRFAYAHDASPFASFADWTVRDARVPVGAQASASTGLILPFSEFATHRMIARSGWWSRPCQVPNSSSIMQRYYTACRLVDRPANSRCTSLPPRSWLSL